MINSAQGPFYPYLHPNLQQSFITWNCFLLFLRFKIKWLAAHCVDNLIKHPFGYFIENRFITSHVECSQLSIFIKNFNPFYTTMIIYFKFVLSKKCTHKQKKKGSQKKICHVACKRMLRTECTSIIYENRGRRGLYPQHFRRSQHGL